MSTLGEMMTLAPNIESFWQSFLATCLPAGAANRRPVNVTDFGDSTEMADELGRLVQAGIKTATSGLSWAFETDNDPPPAVGDLEIVVDGRGEPLCVIEITEVATWPFNAIDEAFAFDYGEGDRTLAWWRHAMWGYCAVECQQLGREPSQTMPLICMRFRLLYTGAG